MKKFLFCACIFAVISLAACGDSTNPSDSSIPDPVVDKNSLTDSRDGRTYRTVVIGSQTWMAENLNFETANSYCYDDKPSNCTKYGRLYAWGAAMDSAGLWSANGNDCGNDKECSPTYPLRGVCPDGWNLPTKAEFETLISSIGDEWVVGGKLRSKTGWNHSNRYQNTDDYSFTALPCGSRLPGGGYSNEGENAFFWSSTEISGDMAYYMTLYYNIDYVKPGYLFKSSGYSVRCIKD